MADVVDAPGAASHSAAVTSWRVRLFCSEEYFALWVTQVVGSTGDWVGLFALTSLAASVSGQPEAATALVLGARVAPSFVLAPFAGLVVDRFDRAMLMRVSDLARALVFLSLPFVDSVAGLVLASLVLEIFTLVWSPAKEALTPSLVRRDQLTRANSLSLVAAYGTMPFAGLVTYALTRLNEQLAEVEWLSALRLDRELGEAQALAFYFDALTFVVAYLVVRIWLSQPRRVSPQGRQRIEGSSRRSALADIRAGAGHVGGHPVVRGVALGLCAGLLGGAMLVPLGPTYAKQVLRDVDAFSLTITVLGTGVAVGVVGLNWLHSRVHKQRWFVASLGFAGPCLLLATATGRMLVCSIGVFGLGVAAGSVYVLGFTLLGEVTTDELRGRTFSAVLMLVRLCVLVAMLVGPLLSAMSTSILRGALPVSHGLPTARLGAFSYPLPGVRVSLWCASALMGVAAVMAARSLASSDGSWAQAGTETAGEQHG